MLENNPEDYDTAFEIMSILRKSGEYTEFVDFLQKLKESTDQSTGLDRRTQMFHTLSWSGEYHDPVSATAVNTKNVDLVKDGYRWVNTSFFLWF